MRKKMKLMIQNMKTVKYSPELKGSVLALGSTILFACQFPLIKISYGYIQIEQAILLEAVFTAFFAFIAAKIKGDGVRFALSIPMAVAAIFNAVGLILLFESLKSVHPATVGFLGRLYFVYAVLLGMTYLKESQSRTDLILIFLITVGVFFISLDETVNLVSEEFIGLCFAALYPLFFASQNAIVKKLVKDHSNQDILFTTKMISLAPLLVYLIVNIGLEGLSFNPYGGLIIGISTFISTFLGLTLMYQALREGSFITINLMKAFQPIFVTIFSLALFPVALGENFWIGASLVVVPAVISVVIRHKREAKVC